jgi:hypothetical protein
MWLPITAALLLGVAAGTRPPLRPQGVEDIVDDVLRGHNARAKKMTPAEAKLWSLRMSLETARIMLETNETLLRLYQKELALPPERRFLDVSPKKIQEVQDAIAKGRRSIQRLEKEIAQAKPTKQKK